MPVGRHAAEDEGLAERSQGQAPKARRARSGWFEQCRSGGPGTEGTEGTKKRGSRALVPSATRSAPKKKNKRKKKQAVVCNSLESFFAPKKP